MTTKQVKRFWSKQNSQESMERIPMRGPYEVVKINNNGSVRVKTLMTQGAVFQTYNIRNMCPFEE